MKKILFSVSLLIGLLAWSSAPVFAQTYSFSVNSTQVNLKINEDGSATIDYVIEFQNDTFASPIDAVDIGLPTSDYALSSISAEVDGMSVADISDSPYVSPGIALNLSSDQAIQPGKSGKVHVLIGRVNKILHPGTEKEAEDYASFQFSPNWFGSEYVHGNTDLTVTITMPPGLKTEEPRYFNPQDWPGKNEPLSGLDSEGRVFYQWQSTNANSSSKYVFGGAFPARLVPSSAISAATIELPEFLNSDNLCCGAFFAIIIGFIALTSWWSNKAANKRKLEYLPPRISVEGHGIKRGLTAVEAAVLMEQPPDRIFTMILYSVVKKGAASVTTRQPLTIKVTDPMPAGLRGYEVEFLNAFKNETIRDQRRDLQDLMVKLIKYVTENMKGFSLKETVAYYKSINEKAWQMIKTADTPEVQAKFFEEAMDWSMVSGDYEKRSEDVFTGRPIFVPMWWGSYDPTIRPMMQGMGQSSSSSTPTQITLPTLPGADFAASMVNSVQTFSGDVLGNITNFTGGVTNKTNPVPVSSSSGHSSGGGCACACACAGCACACAGGGR